MRASCPMSALQEEKTSPKVQDSRDGLRPVCGGAAQTAVDPAEGVQAAELAALRLLFPGE
eukprot:3941223-Pyramimonas_sp.AAC.1